MGDYVASLDIGTTTLRCVILDTKTNIIGAARTTVELLYPKPGYVEICPKHLWTSVVTIINQAIKDAQLSAKDIKCLGISTQRSTFLTWNKATGEPLHNFITWKDIRAKDLCNKLNTSKFVKSFRYLAYCLYLVTRSSRYLTGSRLKIASNHVTGRLLWVLSNIPTVKTAFADNNLLFGTVDTWLLHKFSKNTLHLTDISNAAATGFYDPFVRAWGFWSKILGVPHEILPNVVPNDYDFGVVSEEIFGTAIPIKCVMSDQSSSLFASCCFILNDLKVTMGTGAFLDINTGVDIHASVTGLYPLIAWQIKEETVCMAEGSCNDCGSLVEWLLRMKFLSNPAESCNIAESVEDSGGVFFIPAFSGLGAPINDERAASGFIGVQPTTRREHFVRAVLESIAYRITLLYQTLSKERPTKYKQIIVDGGVGQNDFICQLLSDLTGLKIERLQSTEMSVLGVGFLAGIGAGIWENQIEIQKLRKVIKVFIPNEEKQHLIEQLREFQKWQKAVERFQTWYKEE